ncbi:MAG: ATP-binding protein [Reichenbachiella sp.]|uniref:ATP-binding protein n=1 Tax=Reichenbachiella sp. TaxID=2184521 RepID=UPI003264654A
MNQDSLSYRIFNAAILYFLVVLSVFSVYRLYTGEYLIVGLYLIGIAICLWIYRYSKKGKNLNRVVLPSIFFSILFGVFFWFKVGGVHGGGLVFFTFILISIIVTPRKHSRIMVALLFACQALLVLADFYLQDLPIWGDNPNARTIYLMAVFINMSIVWMLKSNYDKKEEKMAEFSLGLRELHRLNLSHSADKEDVLADYLQSGVNLFNMDVGLIFETKDNVQVVRKSNMPEATSNDILQANLNIIQEIEQQVCTFYRASASSNLDKRVAKGQNHRYFIGTPLVANNKSYGVLFFCAHDSLRKRFEDYDVELMELMALNISQHFSMQEWEEAQAKTDQALLLSDRRFKSIYDYANVGICVCDMEGKIVMANRALQKLLGFTEDELRMHTFYSLSDSGDLDQLSEDLKLYEQIILGEIDHYILEKRKTTKEGNPIYISKTVSTIRDENNEVKFTVMIADDITARKANEEKINGLNQELEIQVDKMEVANKELESFSYSVSHDLRAPLRAIDGFSKIILEDHKDEFTDESKRLLNVIISNSGKMAALIDDLLTFSRITRKVAEFKPIDFNLLISNIIEEQALDEKIFEIDQLPEAKGEKILMKQALANLIGNAIKFSSKKEQPKVQIGYADKEEHYEFFVADNGVGFNMAYYDKIFGVFQRLHTESEFSGTGVGLAIVQKVILKHNGKIWAESHEGIGTTFYFTIPK